MKLSVQFAVLTCLVASSVTFAGTAEEVGAMSAVVFDVSANVSEAFKQAISEQLVAKKWQVKEGQLADAKCGVVPHTTTLTDLNHDGKNEVMLLLGNECTSGKIGGTIYLFTPEADNKVQRQLGFSATGYQVNQRQGAVWADLIFTGTGDCQPVWYNKDGRYNFHHLYEVTPGACSLPSGHNGDK